MVSVRAGIAAGTLAALAITLGVLAAGSQRASGGNSAYIVNTTDDHVPGACQQPPAGDCTLREAIMAANPTGQLVWFDIDGCPPACTIQVSSELPYVSGTGSYVDGRTEPDYDGTPIIVLNGSLIDHDQAPDGFALSGLNTGVGGLVIQGFYEGVAIVTDVNGRRVEDNVIRDGYGTGVTVSRGSGTLIQNNTISNTEDPAILANYDDVVDLTILGNTISGVHNYAVFAEGALTVSGNTITGSDGAGLALIAKPTATVTNNTASANGGEGILVLGASLDVTGNTAAGNGLEGISVFPSEHATVSGNEATGNGTAVSVSRLGGFEDHGAGIAVSGSATVTGNTSEDNRGSGIFVNGVAVVLGGEGTDGNVLTGNELGGVLVSDEATSVTIFGNRIEANMGLGIDLLPLGVTENDSGDADDGANRLQNYPELTSAVAGTLTIGGTLDSRPERDYQIDFYASDECDPSGFGEGAAYLATLLVHTGVDGLAQIEAQTNADVATGKAITATATNLGTGDTSEFSNCVLVTEEGGPTPTPAPTETPGPTPTATPAPTQTPGPTATPGAKNTQGDVDCDGDVDSVDALKDLRHVASLPVQQELGCPDIGGSLARVGLKSDPPNVGAAGAPPAIFGDVDCDGDVDSVDALKILRHVASLPVSQTEPCADIGT